MFFKYIYIELYLSANNIRRYHYLRDLRSEIYIDFYFWLPDIVNTSGKVRYSEILNCNFMSIEIPIHLQHCKDTLKYLLVALPNILNNIEKK